MKVRVYLCGRSVCWVAGIAPAIHGASLHYDFERGGESILYRDNGSVAGVVSLQGCGESEK